MGLKIYELQKVGQYSGASGNENGEDRSLENKNRKIFFERIKKVCVHELGHNFGLPHCPTITCVMEDAKETIKTIDNEELRLCEKCLAKISK